MQEQHDYYVFLDYSMLRMIKKDTRFDRDHRILKMGKITMGW
jgi:hypothetical protein